jgi:hypothetical protein
VRRQEEPPDVWPQPQTFVGKSADAAGKSACATIAKLE